MEKKDTQRGHCMRHRARGVNSSCVYMNEAQPDLGRTYRNNNYTACFKQHEVTGGKGILERSVYISTDVLVKERHWSE